MTPELQGLAERFVVAQEQQAAALEHLATVFGRQGIKAMTDPESRYHGQGRPTPTTGTDE